jgi:TonB family protein
LRCDDCQTDPVTPAHYCECCGRKLSLPEGQHLETAAAPVTPPPEPIAPAEPAASAARCESCGGPSDDGSLCASCQHVFRAFLTTSPETPASPPATVHTTPVVEASPATEVAQSDPLSDVSHWFDCADAAADTPLSPVFADVVIEPQDDLVATEAEAARVEAATVEAARAEAARVEAARVEAAIVEAARVEAVSVEVARVEAAEEEAVKEEAAQPQAANNKVAEIETRSPAPTVATPAAASKRSGGSVKSRHAIGSMVGVAAVVIVTVAGFGLGAYWFETRGLPIPRPAQPKAVAPVVAVAKPVSKPPDPVVIPDSHVVVEAATEARELTPAPERATPAPTTATPKAKPATSSVAPQRVPPTVARQLIPERPVASPAVPAAVPEPVHEAAAPPAPVAEAPRPLAPSPAALGPFFEARDVTVAPQVASRVEPQLPDALRARGLNDIVVVRLLVSQNGHPSSVSLLRRSKAGRPLDDAVVAAVKQWMFSPAQKKGEAVSCWLNVGVPVSRVN